MSLDFFNTTKRSIPLSQLQHAIESTVRLEKHTISHVSAVYCGNRFIKKINRLYLNHTYATDTITFRLNEGKHIEGEFYISLDEIEKNAAAFSTSFDDELLRVTIHSVLHLIGYDDSTKKERAQMTLLEDRYLEYTKRTFSKSLR